MELARYTRDSVTSNAAGLVAPAEERAGGHARGSLDAQQQRGPRLAPDLAGQSLADQRIAPLEPGRGQSVEGPEAVVDTVDQDVAGPAAPGLLGHDAGEGHQRAGLHAGPGHEVVRQLLPEEGRSENGPVGAGRALERGPTPAPP